MNRLKLDSAQKLVDSIVFDADGVRLKVKVYVKLIWISNPQFIVQKIHVICHYQLAKATGVICHNLHNVPTNKILVFDVNQVNSAVTYWCEMPKSA
jgi:hypothetical protein